VVVSFCCGVGFLGVWWGGGGGGGAVCVYICLVLTGSLTLFCSRSQMTNTTVMDVPYAGNCHTDRQSSTYRSKVLLLLIVQNRWCR